jgi:hypothetical protein
MYGAGTNMAKAGRSMLQGFATSHNPPTIIHVHGAYGMAAVETGNHSNRFDYNVFKRDVKPFATGVGNVLASRN